MKQYDLVGVAGLVIAVVVISCLIFISWGATM